MTRENVILAYKFLYGREPESEQVIEQHLTHKDFESFISGFVGTPEYKRRIKSSTDFLFDGYAEADIALMQKYLVDSEAEADFVKDFMGSRMRVASAGFTAGLGGKVYNILPIPHDYRAETIEWVGTIKAVEASKDNFVGVELGAGWGPWVVSAALLAKRLGREEIKIVAVEADAQKFENMKLHIADNGFDPEQQDLHQAIIGAKSGTAFFPIIDSIGNWGGEAVFAAKAPTDGKEYVKLRSLRLSELLKPYKSVDLIHFDIQGAEADVVEDSIKTLQDKVRYLVIGTHSRMVEGRIVDVLLKSGFNLENEQPCRSNYTDGKANVIIDGTQVWRNSAF